MIWLCSSARRALRWRFTMLIPSTVMRPVFENTRMTFPSFVLSLPRITRTVSPLVIGIETRSDFRACRIAFRPDSFFRWTRRRMLDDLRSQRHDLHVPALAQLARHRAEDAGRLRLTLLVDDHDGVLVEPDVAPVLAAGLLDRANHDGARDLGLLHRAVRQRVLDGDDDRIAQAGVPPAGAAQHADDQRALGARVVRDADHAFLLDHGCVPLPCAVDDLDHAPPLVLRQRARLHDAHRIAGLRVVLLVMRFHLRGARYHLAVAGVREAPLEANHDGLLHLVANYDTQAHLARTARGRRVGRHALGHSVS